MTVGRDLPVPRAIGIARVLGILGIIYAHAWTGRTPDELTALDSSGQGILRWALIELIGHSAVPLLGAISGWLAESSVHKRSYWAFVGTKARTILVPMLLWNAIIMALVSAFAIWGTLQTNLPDGPLQALDWWLCLTEPNKIVFQAYFLRDLFVCMLAAPLLGRLPSGWLWALIVGSLAWSIYDVRFPLLLRPLILSFFLTGMLVRRYGLVEQIARWPLAACIAPYLLMVPVMSWLASQNGDWLLAHVRRANAIDLFMRVTAALALCRIALELASTRLGRVVLGGERYAFLLFCCHMLLIWLLGPIVGQLTGPLGSPAYPALLLVQPVLVLGGTVLIGRALLVVSPRLAGWLSGGRLAPHAPLPPRAPSAKEPASSPPGA